jgi:hypothetical protein
MDPSPVYTLYHELAGEQIVFAYSGRFPDDHTARLIALSEEQMDGTSDRTRKGRLSFVLVESYQNIVRHRAPLPPALMRTSGRSLFVLRMDDLGSEVITMNPVLPEEAEQLRTNLDLLGEMDQEGLKERSLQGLHRGQRTSRGGAGLGLIEMTRRSGHVLRYRFTEGGPGFTLFTLRASLGERSPKEDDDALPDRLHAAIVRSDILLLCMGRSTPGHQSSMERVIEVEVERGPEKTALLLACYRKGMAFLESAGSEKQGHLFALAYENGRHRVWMGTVMAPGMAELVEATVAKEEIEDTASTNAVNGPKSPTKAPFGRLLNDLLGSAGAPSSCTRYTRAGGELVLLSFEV